MTIDERLERLAERHEALAESVESLRDSVYAQGQTMDKILQAIKADSENIAALARVVQIHESRLTDLEG